MSSNKLQFSPSKNPWNKNKKKKTNSKAKQPINAQKKQSQINDWPGLESKLAATNLNISTPPKNVTEPNQRHSSSSNSNNTSGSTPNVKFKAKQPAPTPPQNQTQNEDAMHLLPSNGHYNTSPFKRNEQHPAITPQQPITPKKSENLQKTESVTTQTQTIESNANESTQTQTQTNKSSNSSNTSSNSSTPKSAKSKKSTNRRKRKKLLQQQQNQNANAQPTENIPIVPNPQSITINTPKKAEIAQRTSITPSNDSSIISSDSISLPTDNNNQHQNMNPIEIAQQLQNGTAQSQQNGHVHSSPKGSDGSNQDMRPRSYQNFKYRQRHRHDNGYNNHRYNNNNDMRGRGRGRGKRGRGGRGRRGGGGGYRQQQQNNGYYEDNNQRGQYRDDRSNRPYGNAPRHNRPMQSMDANPMNPSNPIMTQPPPIQYMAVPVIPLQTFPLPMNNNVQNIEKEGEEKKSDTSGSTIPNANDNLSTTGTATTTTTASIPSTSLIYNPYINPYILNPYGMTTTLGAMEPPDNIHLTISQMSQCPDWNGEISLPTGPYFVLKVSCVATGFGADDRSVGHIALLNWNLQTKANVFVKPKDPITSYIEPLTSLTPDLLNKYGYSLEAAINIIKSELPTNAVLIGQNITMDLEWLGMKMGQDFRTFIDLRDIWRTWSNKYRSYTHYSLTHQAKYILNDEHADKQKHSASADAITTMKLFQYYVWCRYYNMQIFHQKILTLSNTKIEPSFSKKHPMYEGVQMISKKYKGVPYITANINAKKQQKPLETMNESQEEDGGDIKTTTE